VTFESAENALDRDGIEAIQSLRAIAALMVITRHTPFPSAMGGAGVDLFFVISGFVIHHVRSLAISNQYRYLLCVG